MPLYIGPWQEMKLARMISACQRNQTSHTTHFLHHAAVETSSNAKKSLTQRSQGNASNIQNESNLSAVPQRLNQKTREWPNNKEVMLETIGRTECDIQSKPPDRSRPIRTMEQSGNRKKRSNCLFSSCSIGNKNRMGEKKKRGQQMANKKKGGTQTQVERVNQMRRTYMKLTKDEQQRDKHPPESRHISTIADNSKEIYQLDYPRSTSRPIRETKLDQEKIMEIDSQEDMIMENVDQLIHWAHSLSVEGL
jgi:hypothetical protein